jgi:hypothetical protein
VAARYWVLVADELIDAHPQFPATLRTVKRGHAEILAVHDMHPSTHWWLFEDDDAPEELNNKRVELTFLRIDGGRIEIMDRRPASTSALR